MSFTEVDADTRPKHIRIVEAVKAVDEEEAIALWELITNPTLSASAASLAIKDEMPKYTDNKKLQSLSERHILRIRKGLVS